MIELTKNIETERIKAYLETLKPYLKSDVSNYAKGRQRLWLGAEPLLYRPFNSIPGHPVEEKVLDRFRELIEFDFDFCLVTFSGDPPIGIEPHRDAGYADFLAYGLNIGNCKFEYWNSKQTLDKNFPSVPCEIPTVLNLVPGDVIRFNCKNLHAAYPSPNRWGINFWRKKEI